MEYPGYLISTTGDVRHHNRAKPLTKRAPWGYVSISVGKKKVQINPARYVLSTFTGEWDDDLEVRHLDGDRMNAALDNIELVVPQCPHGHDRIGANLTHSGRCWACQRARMHSDGWTQERADEAFERRMTDGGIPQGDYYMQVAKRDRQGRILPLERG